MKDEMFKSRPCKANKQHAEVPDGKGYDKFPGMEKSMRGAGMESLKTGVSSKSSDGFSDLHGIFENAPKMKK